MAGLNCQSKSSRVFKPRKSAALVRRASRRSWRTLSSSCTISSRNSAWESRLAAASCRRTPKLWHRPESRSCLRLVSRLVGFISSGGLRVEGVSVFKAGWQKCSIRVQVANQRMGFQKVQLDHVGGLCQQLFEIAQMKAPVMKGFGGCGFQVGHRMFLRQTQQTLQHAQALDAALGIHRFGPRASVAADQAGSVQQIVQAPLYDVPFISLQMRRVGAELARLAARR